MNSVKKIKKINPFLRSSILHLDDYQIIFVCLLYRNVNAYFAKSIVTEIQSFGFLADLQKKKLFQNFIFETKKLRIKLHGNIIFLSLDRLSPLLLNALSDLQKYPDVQFFVGAYKNFFLSPSRLNCLISSNFLPDTYYASLKTYYSGLILVFKLIRLIYNVIYLYLYRLHFFCINNNHVCKNI